MKKTQKKEKDDKKNKDKEIKIAHEFGDIKFNENHPKVSKTLHILGLIPFIGEIPIFIKESLGIWVFKLYSSQFSFSCYASFIKGVDHRVYPSN